MADKYQAQTRTVSGGNFPTEVANFASLGGGDILDPNLSHNDTLIGTHLSEPINFNQTKYTGTGSAICGSSAETLLVFFVNFCCLLSSFSRARI